MKKFARFMKDESGVTAIEYGLIAAAIAMVLIVSAKPLGNAIGDLFNNVKNNISS